MGAGVLRESILEPLLFNIYISDTTGTAEHSQFSMYADGTISEYTLPKNLILCRCIEPHSRTCLLVNLSESAEFL